MTYRYSVNICLGNVPNFVANKWAYLTVYKLLVVVSMLSFYFYRDLRRL